VIRVPDDFNSMTEDGKRVFINTQVFPDFRNILVPGQRVILFTEGDVELQGTIEIDTDPEGTKWWYGVIDWSTQRDISTK